jgi:flagellar basal-body rod protein FlgG
MLQSLNTASTGMAAQQYNLDVISNNLANVNTTGFKSQRAEFEDLTYQTPQVSGTTNTSTAVQPTSVQVGMGANFVASVTNFTQGALSQTGNTYDMAINGAGFFMVTLSDGSTAYTRDGNFQTDSAGNLVDDNGNKVSPAITVPTGAKSISIGADGTVSAILVGSTDPQTIGNIKTAVFPNQGGLTRIGDNLYTASAGSGAATITTPGEQGSGSIQQSYLEGSNVSVVDEMVRMIMAQRAYEINSKVVQTGDQMLSMTDNLRGS